MGHSLSLIHWSEISKYDHETWKKESACYLCYHDFNEVEYYYKL
jgi:hypothetical protein